MQPPQQPLQQPPPPLQQQPQQQHHQQHHQKQHRHQHKHPQQQQQERSRLRSANSLVALLFALEGRWLTLELRSDVLVSGRLAGVDEHMNVWVADAVWQPLQGPAQMFPRLYLRGRQLRMVHLPAGLDAAATLQRHIDSARKARVAAALGILNSRHERLAKGQRAAGEGEDEEDDEDGGQHA